MQQVIHPRTIPVIYITAANPNQTIKFTNLILLCAAAAVLVGLFGNFLFVFFLSGSDSSSSQTVKKWTASVSELKQFNNKVY